MLPGRKWILHHLREWFWIAFRRAVGNARAPGGRQRPPAGARRGFGSQPTTSSPRHPPRPALLILELAPNGAAERASLLAGDILVEAAGQPLQTPDELAAALAGGDTVQFAFHRAGDARIRKVTVDLVPLKQANAA